MSRPKVTRKLLGTLLGYLCRELGVNSARYEKGTDGKHKPIPGLMIEHSTFPHGYRLAELLDSTGEKDHTALMSAREMAIFLRGALWALQANRRDGLLLSCRRTDEHR